MRWSKWNYYYTLLLIALSSVNIQAQDFTFSQFYHTNFIYNPALTGHIPASYRLATLYRQQWGNIGGGFQNYALAGDINLNDNNFGTKPGLGIALMQEESMGGNLKNTNALFSAAIHQQIGKSKKYFLSIGMQGGVLTRRYKTAGLKFASGILGGVNEVITVPNTTNFDLRVGINWTSFFNNERFVIKMGASYLHLGGIKETVLLRVSTIEPAIVVHGSIDWYFKKFKKEMLFVPAFLVMSQGGSRQYNFGGTYHLTLNEDFNIFSGIYWRVNESIIPSVGVQYKTIKFTISKDVPTKAVLSGGSLEDNWEISIGFDGQLARSRKPIDSDKIDDLLLQGL